MIVVIERIIPVLHHKKRICPPDVARPPAVTLAESSARIVFTDNPLVRIEEVGDFRSDLLPDPPPKGVIRVRGGVPVGKLHAREPVGGAVVVPGGGTAHALRYRIAVGVVGEARAVEGKELVVLVVVPGPL